MSALLLVPAVVVLAFYVLAFALFGASGRADRRIERFQRTPGGWRSR